MPASTLRRARPAGGAILDCSPEDPAGSPAWGTDAASPDTGSLIDDACTTSTVSGTFRRPHGRLPALTGPRRPDPRIPRRDRQARRWSSTSPPPGPPLAPGGLGRSDWHVFCAALNCGELGSIPAPFCPRFVSRHRRRCGRFPDRGSWGLRGCACTWRNSERFPASWPALLRLEPSLRLAPASRRSSAPPGTAPRKGSGRSRGRCGRCCGGAACLRSVRGIPAPRACACTASRQPSSAGRLRCFPGRMSRRHLRASRRRCWRRGARHPGWMSRHRTRQGAVPRSQARPCRGSFSSCRHHAGSNLRIG